MSPIEHYFENLLFHYAKTRESVYKYDDTNTRQFNDEIKSTIRECATYIIDCCGWNPEVVEKFLDGNFKITSEK